MHNRYFFKKSITHLDPTEGRADLSDATLLKSVSVVTFDDDVTEVPLVRRDETRDVPAVGGINRSGYLQRIQLDSIWTQFLDLTYIGNVFSES